MIRRLKRLLGDRSDELDELERVRQRCRRRFKEEYGYDMPDFADEAGADLKELEAKYGIKVPVRKMTPEHRCRFRY